MLFSIRAARRILGLAVGASLAAAGVANADVKLSGMFSDHMVLQQQLNVPVWGTADAGEEITVSFGSQKVSGKADDKGHWLVKLAPLTASDKGAELVVAGKNKVELKDVLVGEVWICSGQSNMEMGISIVKDGKKEVEAANHPLLRLYSVPRRVSYEPQHALDAKIPEHTGQWLVCTPENVMVGQWAGFSACGYFFGRDLQNDLKIPVGLIHSSWGGTVAEAWAEQNHLASDPEFKAMIESRDQGIANYEKQVEAFKKAEAAAKEAEKSRLDAKNVQPGDKPPVIKQVKKPQAPRDPHGNPNQASVLYNGMIQPIVPYAVRGAIWYQGESNASRGYQYRKLLPLMINSWRDVFNEPSLDFYIVSLANFQKPAVNPGDDNWAELREAQAMTAALPHNGQALAIDLADADKPQDIHPHDKQSVGHRLELVAMAKTYGKQVDYSGPVYKASKIDGGNVIISLDFADGLSAKGGEIKGFQIAGEDHKWVWADAKIDGSTIVVSSKEVAKPAAVRYDWSINPQGNVYNKASLPLAPFRTDDWPGLSAPKPAAK